MAAMDASGSRQSAADRRGRSRARAFTLIEILLVLGLIAVFSAVLLPATGVLFQRVDRASAEDLALGVLQEARQHAVISGHPIRLSFDADAQRFVLADRDTRVHRPAGEDRLTLEFLPARDVASVLIGGQLIETGAVDHMTIYPDGTCDPVRLQIRAEGREPQVIAIDPWTCAPGLEMTG